MENFKTFIKRLRAEALVKSFLIAFLASNIIGFMVCFAIWIFGSISFLQNYTWILIIISIILGLTVTVTAILYFTVFRPTQKVLAKRLDALGLDERIITMQELNNDNSFMAKKQREDALHALSKINVKMLKIAVSIPLIICCCVAVMATSGMSAVLALSANGVVKTGEEVIKQIEDAQVPEYEVEYDVYGDGEIIGEIFQVVKEGQSTESVYAEAFDNWFFIGWIDLDAELSPFEAEAVLEHLELVESLKEATGEELTEKEKASIQQRYLIETKVQQLVNAISMGMEKMGYPERAEEQVMSDMHILAVFYEMDDVRREKEWDKEPGDPDPQKDDSRDLPMDEMPAPEEGPEQEGGKGTDPSKMTSDGKTPAEGKTLGEAIDSAQEGVSGNGDIGSEEGKIVGDYLGSL